MHTCILIICYTYIRETEYILLMVSSVTKFQLCFNSTDESSGNQSSSQTRGRMISSAVQVSPWTEDNTVNSAGTL